MKKNIFQTLLLAAIIPFATMCSKESNQPEAAQPDSLVASVGTDEEKVSFTPSDGALTLAWEEGDAIRVNGTNSQVFTIKSGFSGHKAQFEGNTVSGTSFDILYPSTYETKEAIMARTYTGQVQDGNGSAAHLEYNALIEGADDYHTVVFDKSKSNVKVNGVLKLVVKMPDGVSGIKDITLTAPSAIFYTDNAGNTTTNSIGVSFTNTTVDSNNKLTAYIMTSMKKATIEAGVKLTLKVTVPDKGCYYTKTFSNPSAVEINGGQTLNIDISDATTMNHKIVGAGTEASPYELWDKEDVLLMKDLLGSNTTYFKMMDNIDMKSVENWTPINIGSNEIYFDGNHKTISNLTVTNKSYSSFFGVLLGTAKNLTFDKATISNTINATGVIGGYIGNIGEVYAKAENITIKNSTVTLNTSGACNAGIGFGSAGYADIDGIVIENSSISYTTGTADNYVGGILGGTNNDRVCNITNCTCDEDVTITCTNASKGIGGIVGNIGRAEGETIEKCTFSGTIDPGTTVQYAGGIAGIIWKSGSTYSTTVKKCHNYSSISASGTKYVGGIAGYMQKGTVTDCHNHNTVSANSYIGGIIGQCEKEVNVSSCTNSGKISASGGYVGGITGLHKAGNLEDCTNEGDVDSKSNYAGGIVGEHNANDITGCKNKAEVTSSTANYAGGIVAHNKGDVKLCQNTGPVSGSKYIGGVIGFLDIGNADQCLNRGTITGSEDVGGIVGVFSNASSTTEYTISNCYNNSEIWSTGQMAGGIVGDARKKTTFKALYSLGTIKGKNISSNQGRALGGIIGRMSNGTSTAAGQNYNNLLYYCISYVDEINASGNTSNYSSGAIVGFTGTKLASAYCYRSATITLTCTAKPDGVDMLVNQGQSVKSSTGITEGISPDYWYPYHGNAVSSTASFPGVSSVAKYINTKAADAWDTSIWNLDGLHPVLINNPE